MYFEEREAWPGDSVLAEMKACWLDSRDELLERLAAQRPLWGELVFDQSQDPQDALMHGYVPPSPTRWQIEHGYA